MSIIKENHQDGQQKIFDVNAKVLVPYSSISVKKTRNRGGAHGLRVSRVE